MLEEVVDRFFLLYVIVHGALEVETHPRLNTAPTSAEGEVGTEYEVEHQGSGEDAVAAEEVHLDLHAVVLAHPSEDVEVVPTFLGITTRRIVIDAHLVEDVAVEFGLFVRLKDSVDDAEL